MHSFAHLTSSDQQFSSNRKSHHRKIWSGLSPDFLTFNVRFIVKEKKRERENLQKPEADRKSDSKSNARRSASGIEPIKTSQSHAARSLLALAQRVAHHLRPNRHRLFARVVHEHSMVVQMGQRRIHLTTHALEFTRKLDPRANLVFSKLSQNGQNQRPRCKNER